MKTIPHTPDCAFNQCPACAAHIDRLTALVRVAHCPNVKTCAMPNDNTECDWCRKVKELTE